MNLSVEWDVIRATQQTSFVAIAKKINCGRKTLYGMINTDNPTLKTLEKLGQAFEVDYLDVIRSARERK